MEVKSLIKKQLLQYLLNEISKEELCKWAIDRIHKMLEGDIFKLSCLEVWSIMTEIAGMNDSDDFYCRELAHRYVEVLSGNRDDSFLFTIKIPAKYVVNNLPGLKEVIKKYLVEKRLSQSEMDELRFIAQKEMNEADTLNEILENQIVNLLRLGYELPDDESSMDYDLKSTVFISEEMSACLEDELLEKIIRLLECYEGNRCFFIHISFRNGDGNLSVIV